MKNFKFILAALLALSPAIASKAQAQVPSAQTIGAGNLIPNGSFEQGRARWSTFSTTMTGTLPTGTVGTCSSCSITTFGSDNSTPLRQNSSLLTSSSGAWAAGSGFISNAFTIPLGYRGRTLSYSAIYAALSGSANANFSGTSSNTFAIYIWDQTNSKWIQPSGVYNFLSASGSTTGTFQPDSTTASIRIALLAVNASAGAISFDWDDFSLGVQQSVQAPPLSDWTSYTCTSNMTTNTTTTCQYRRVGGNLEGKAQLSFAGAPNTPGVDITVSLPAGLNSDPTKLTLINAGTLSTLPGSGILSCTNGGLAYHIMPYYQSATTGTTKVGLGEMLTNTVYTGTTYPSDTGPTPTSPCTMASGGAISVNWTIPIAGWSSNTASSADSDQRVVAMYVTQATPTATLTGTVSLVKYTVTPGYDTHGAFNTTTGLYTCPVSGYYRANMGLAITNSGGAGTNAQIALAKNGTTSNVMAQLYTLAGAQTLFPSGSFTVFCNVGDTLAPYASVSTASTPSVQTNAGVNFFQVERISGAPVVQAGDSVSAHYYTLAGQSIANGSGAVIVFGTKDFDQTGSMNTSTGVYTFPVAGKFRVNCFVSFASASWSASAGEQLLVQKNGSNYRQVAQSINWAAVTASPGLNGSTTLNVVAGDTTSCLVLHGEGTARSLNTGAASHIEIERVGN